MNIKIDKKRRPLGYALIKAEKWRREKIKQKLADIGVTPNQWRGILNYAEAHRLSGIVKEVILEEMPEISKLFEDPRTRPGMTYSIPKFIKNKYPNQL